MTYTTVLYHAHCPDGLAAAFACWQRFGDEAQYLPVAYGQPAPEIPDEHTIYVVDFSYDASQLKTWLFRRLNLGKRRAPYIVVLDHHASAQRDLQGLQAQQLRGLDIRFDMQESGATLTWKYLRTNGDLPAFTLETKRWAALEEAMPLFFHYVRDRDLWQWRLPNSRAISMVYRLTPPDFASIAAFAQQLNDVDSAERIVAQGAAILRYADALVEEQASRAEVAIIAGYAVPIVNATTLFSEVGDYLCRVGLSDAPQPPFVAYYFDRNDGKRQWGLRSRDGFDCSLAAKQYGGGGHPGAAGFVTAQTWRGEEAQPCS